MLQSEELWVPSPTPYFPGDEPGSGEVVQHSQVMKPVTSRGSRTTGWPVFFPPELVGFLNLRFKFPVQSGMGPTRISVVFLFGFLHIKPRNIFPVDLEVWLLDTACSPIPWSAPYLSWLPQPPSQDYVKDPSVTFLYCRLTQCCNSWPLLPVRHSPKTGPKSGSSSPFWSDEFFKQTLEEKLVGIGRNNLRCWGKGDDPPMSVMSLLKICKLEVNTATASGEQWSSLAKVPKWGHCEKPHICQLGNTENHFSVLCVSFPICEGVQGMG